MVEQGVLTGGEVISYAGGLFVDTFQGRPAVTHTGATSGYRAYLGHFPDDGLSVAILCNTGNANPGQLGGAVARLFLPPRSETPVSGDAEEAAAAPSAEPGAGADPWDPADPGEYVGVYTSQEAETTWVIEVDAGEVVLVRRPGTRVTLRHLADAEEPDTFQGAGGRVRFIRDASGRVVELSVQQARVWDLRFQREGG
jgi:hypothetical protein